MTMKSTMIAVMSILMAGFCQAKEFNFGTFNLDTSDYGSFIDLMVKGKKLARGTLFLAVESDKDGRFFQSNAAGKVDTVCSVADGKAVVSWGGASVTQNNVLGVKMAYKEEIQVFPDGTLKFVCELTPPADFKPENVSQI